MSGPPAAPDATRRPSVVLVRGHQANPWELGPWQQPAIAERFDVSYLRSARGWFDTSRIALPGRRAWTLRDVLPPGRLGDAAVRLPGDRYLGLGRLLRGAAIVHSQELGYWYSMQAAQLRAHLGFKLVLTVWETIPFLDAYRNVRTRAYRVRTLAATDLFLAATERARTALLLEGAPPDRILVVPPGIDVDRFAAAGSDRREQTAEPLILSPGRLVWEKGHQDVLRALALLRGGLDGREPIAARVLIVGSGAEEARLRAHARELGVADAVEFRGFIAYDEMPRVYAHASCLILASLPTWSWEEQFGMVLAEAMAAGLPVLASTSGAIPEVTGAGARHFSAGDWPQIATQLRDVLSGGPPVGAVDVQRFSTAAAAQRLAQAYDHVLSRGRSSPPERASAR